MSEYKTNPKYHSTDIIENIIIKSEFTCLACGKDFEDGKKLNNHIKFEHGYKSKDYYDKYKKKDGEGICVICGKETEFFTVTDGYFETCSKECKTIHITKLRNEEEYVENMRKVQMGHFVSQETKDNIGKANLGNPSPFLGKHWSEEDKKTQSKTKKLWWESLSDDERNQMAKEKKERWESLPEGEKLKRAKSISDAHQKNKEENPDFFNEYTARRIKNSLAKVCEFPNKFEQNCAKVLELEYLGKFKYVGNGEEYINYKSPDFINYEDRVVVLCHGIYWHLLRDGLENTPEIKREIEKKDSEPFERAGYKVIVLWEDEIAKDS